MGFGEHEDVAADSERHGWVRLRVRVIFARGLESETGVRGGARGLPMTVSSAQRAKPRPSAQAASFSSVVERAHAIALAAQDATGGARALRGRGDAAGRDRAAARSMH